MAKIKILLVEDDKSLREIYGVRLLAEGYDIVSAGDGEEALAMAIKERPALIVSDVMMPKISGFDMLDILRSTTETKDVKVIMMTALSSDDQRQRGESLGADRYLVKSQVGIEDVVRTVHEVLGDIPGLTPARPAPVSPVAPQPTPMPQPAAAPAPQATARPDVAALSPQPTAQPLPQPGSMPAPANPLTTGTTQPATTLPQPTAPFSSPAPRPNNLGNRVIQPLSPSETTAEQDVAKQMEAELSNAMQQMSAPSQPTPIPQPVPMPPPATTAPMPAQAPQPTAPAPVMPQSAPLPQQPTPMPQPAAPSSQPTMPTPQPTEPLPPTPQAQ